MDNFSFEEKSTRKALVFSIIGSIVFYILFYNEYLFNVSNYRVDAATLSTLGMLIFGAITFILGLIMFRSENLLVILFYPLWYICALFITSDPIRSIGDLLITIIGSFAITMVCFFALGAMFEWIKQGK